MKLRTILLSLTFIVAATAALIIIQPSSEKTSNTAATAAHVQNDEVSAKLAGASEYKKWLYEQRKNPVTGRIDYADVLAAKEQVRVARNSNASARDLGLAWEHLGPSNVGGRTRSILITKSNPLRMYAGSVSGGLFVSDNGGLNWEPHPQNPQFESTLITTMTEAANGDIYFGTGEGFIGFYTGNSQETHDFTGNGVYKSSDGGATFSLLSSTEPTPGTIGSGASEDWAYVNRIAAHPFEADKLIAATRRGLYFTTDGGVNWDIAQRDGNLMISAADDCLFGPDGVAHIIYVDAYARNDGSDISNFSSNSYGSGLPIPSEVSRAVIAVAPSDPNYVYVYTSRQQGMDHVLGGIFQSTNAGASFTPISSGSSSAFNPPGSQGNYNLCIGVNPTNPERVYIGGQTEAWSWTPLTGWNTIAASFFGAANARYIHADHHAIVFHPTNPNTMYFATDGGIFRTQNASAAIPDFSDLNKGYSTFQAHGVAGGLNGETLGGSQDNGTAFIDFTLNETDQSRQVLGGDGAEAEASKIDPRFIFASFYNFAVGSGALRRSANSGGSFIDFFDFNISPDGGGFPAGASAFVEADFLWEDFDKWHTFSPVLEGLSVEWPIGSGTLVTEGETVTYEGQSLELTRDNLIDARFFYGTDSRGLWFTPQALQSSTLGPPEWFRLGLLDVDVTAIDVSEDGDHVYFGTDAGEIYRVSGMNSADFSYTSGAWDPVAAGLTITRIFNWSGIGVITGISVAWDNPDEVVITRGGFGVSDNVRRCTDATSAGTDAANFLSISTSLPNIPVFDCMVNRYSANEVLIATEFGVWSYDVDDPTTAWTQETSIVGNVPVFEIRQDVMREPGCYPIYIATHGRGFFRAVNNVDPALGCDFEIRSTATGLDDAPIALNAITELSLAPNPSCLTSQLTVHLDAGGMTHISLYDLSGKRIREIARQNMPMGKSQFELETSSLTSGTYLVVAEHQGQLKSTKLVVCDR